MAQEDLQALDRFLAQLTESLNRGKAGVAAFELMHAGRPLRLPDGSPVTGLDDAAWGPLAEPTVAHWELVVGGAVVARVFAPQRGGPWSYQMFVSSRPRAKPWSPGAEEVEDVIQAPETPSQEIARTRRNVNRLAGHLARAEDHTDMTREAYLRASEGDPAVRREYEAAIERETDARRAHRHAEKRATEARARRRAEERAGRAGAEREPRDQGTSGDA